MDDCIAANAEQYVNIAVRLGRNPDFGSYIRKKISERSDMLFNCSAAVRAFEEFCVHAVYRDGMGGSSACELRHVQKGHLGSVI
jgi:hypothetical protein